MSIVRWNSFGDIDTLRQSMDQLFDEVFTRRPVGIREVASRVWEPAAEMFETDREVVVRAELPDVDPKQVDRKSTRLNSSHSQISYAVFCLKKKKKKKKRKYQIIVMHK